MRREPEQLAPVQVRAVERVQGPERVLERVQVRAVGQQPQRALPG